MNDGTVVTPLMRPDFRCTERVKYLLIEPLKKGHYSCKPTFSLQKGWPYKRGTTEYTKTVNISQDVDKQINFIMVSHRLVMTQNTVKPVLRGHLWYKENVAL